MDYNNLDPQPDAPEYCGCMISIDNGTTLVPCLQQTKVMSFKGTGVCGEEHWKLRKSQEKE